MTHDEPPFQGGRSDTPLRQLSPEERRRRLALGLRKNRGRLWMQEFVADAAEALGRAADTIRVTDLETYDHLQSLSGAYGGHGPVFEHSWFPDQVDEIRCLLETLKQSVPDEPLFLFLFRSQYCGAVETRSHEVLERAFQLTSGYQEEAYATNHDGTAGILLEYGVYLAPAPGPGKNIGYQLRVWGDVWLRAVES